MRARMPDRAVKRFIGSLRKAVARSGDELSELASTRAFSWFAIMLLAAAITVVTTISFERIPTRISVGQVAPRDIKSDRNYEILDAEATDKLRDEAMQSVLPVYDFDPALAEQKAETVRAAFEDARLMMRSWGEGPKSAGRRKNGAVVLSAERRAELASMLSGALGVTVPPELAGGLSGTGFDESVEDAVVRLVQRVMAQPVVAADDVEEGGGARSVLMRTLERPESAGAGRFGEESIVSDVGSFMRVAKARSSIDDADAAALRVQSKAQQEAVVGLARLLISPNLAPNRNETALRRDQAASGAKDVVIRLKAGEMIIREGARFDSRHIKVLTGIRTEKRRASYYLEFIGTYILVLCFLTIPFLLLEKFFRQVRVRHEDHVLMALVGLSILVLMRLSLTLAPAVRDALFLSLDPQVLHYLVPVAGGAMLVRMFLRPVVSFVFAIILSVLAGLFVETDVRFVAYSLITSMTAIMAVTHVDRRSNIIRAGAITGLMGAVTVLGISLIMIATSPDVITVSETLWGVLFAFLAGLGAAIYSMIAAPIVESVSGYASDIKLLELANLNHPLLRELVVRAPGTYHHSHLVGLLGEAAAAEIGANALLVRVGAYYHDIGKLKKPLYFVENSRAGENRHEKLSPHMSSLIVSAHVKDGLDLAASNKIPRAISDMIPQHHGTRQISFFYDKAKSQEDPELQKIDQKDFQYPGPKPQTREAAILMLSDVTEASVRSLKEKSSTRIEQTVQKTIHDIFNESQLDECDLTLRDLNLIGKAFVRTLLGIYHSRIDYAKEVENGNQRKTEESRGAEDQGEAQKPAPEAGAGPPDDKKGA